MVLVIIVCHLISPKFNQSREYALIEIYEDAFGEHYVLPQIRIIRKEDLATRWLGNFTSWEVANKKWLAQFED